MSTPRRRPKGISLRIGQTEITKVGISRFDLHDVYHWILSLSWPQFFAGAIGVYLLANLVFATAYFLGDHAVANARPDSFADVFFFSVETLATVGYGYMSPGSLYGHIVATVEILTGLLSLAVITSLVFVRFSKPTARVLFSNVAVIAPFNGLPTLMLRVANKRRSFILEAAAIVTLVRDEMTREGNSIRRFYELKLDRQRSPVFPLTWTIMHFIDASSPLHGISQSDLVDADMRLVVTFTGVDETFAAAVHARSDYSADKIRFGHRFRDVLVEGEDGHVYVHLQRFHDVELVTADAEKGAARP